MEELVMPEVKIEMDVAEELPNSWTSQKHVEALEEPSEDTVSRTKTGNLSDSPIGPNDQMTVLVKQEPTEGRVTSSLAFQQKMDRKPERETGTVEPVSTCSQTQDSDLNLKTEEKNERIWVKQEPAEDGWAEPLSSDWKTDIKQEQDSVSSNSESLHGRAPCEVGATEPFIKVKSSKTHTGKAWTGMSETDNSEVLEKDELTDFPPSDRSMEVATPFHTEEMFSVQHSYHGQSTNCEAASDVSSKLSVPADSNPVTWNRQYVGHGSFDDKSISGQMSQMPQNHNIITCTTVQPPLTASSMIKQKHTVSPSDTISSGNMQIHIKYPLVTVITKGMQNHSGERSYSCRECNATFTESDQLTEQKPSLCKECSVKFARSDRLSVNMLECTKQRPYSCTICGATYMRAGHLTAHLRKHNGQRPFSCKECDATFTQSSHLTTHMRKHTGQRPFSCKECSATFKQSGHLSVHMRIHKGERPYICGECGASFIVSSQLAVHIMRKHIRQKCCLSKESSATSTQHDHLTSHIQKDSNRVKESSATLTQSTQTSVHRQKRMDQRPYMCKECSATFTHPGHLTRHMRKHTG